MKLQLKECTNRHNFILPLFPCRIVARGEKNLYPYPQHLPPGCGYPCLLAGEKERVNFMKASYLVLR